MAIEESREDEQHDVESGDDDHREINRFVSHEIGVGENVAPVDRRGQREKTAGERRQMRGKTLRLEFVGRRADLKRVETSSERERETLETDRQAERLPKTFFVEKITTRSKTAEPIVRAEKSSFDVERRGAQRSIEKTEFVHFARIHFSQTEDQRAVIRRLFVVEELRENAPIRPF